MTPLGLRKLLLAAMVAGGLVELPLTVLNQYIKTFLYKKIVVEYNEPEGKGEDVVACSDFEELTDASL